MTVPVRSVFFAPASDGSRTSWRGTIVIALAAIMAMAPEFIVGLTVTDNYRFNLLWSEQFAELVRTYHLYPRWLPRAWAGLGAPTFYFYPPFFFWIASLVDTLTGGTLGPERFVPIGTTLLLAASGFAMRAWLRSIGNERAALLGAVAYMLAPYHLYDIYCRGALAEASAYAATPALLLALARLGQGHYRYIAGLAAAYAILLMTHLPTALLVSILLIPAFVVWTAMRIERPMPFLISGFVGGILGIALAALYLVPALSLLSFVNSGALNQGFYQPETWFFWKMPAGPMGGRMLFIIPTAVGAALLAASAIIARNRGKAHRAVIFWAALTLVVVLLIAGLIPHFWNLPGLSLVQFPWRALLIVEFAAITMLATLNWKIPGPVPLAALTVMAFAYALFGMMGLHTIRRTIDGQSFTASQLRQDYLDAPEYTPKGVRIHDADDPERVHVELSDAPLISASDPRAAVKVADGADGTASIRVESPATTTISLRRYYFPQWRVRAADGRELPVSPDVQDRIITFSAPAGKSVLRLEHGVVPNEILSRAISLCALLLLALIAALPQRRFSPGSPGPLPPRPQAPE